MQDNKLTKTFASGVATIGILTGTIGIISPVSAATFSVNGTFDDGASLSGTFELDENGSPGNFSLTTTSGNPPNPPFLPEIYDPSTGGIVDLSVSADSFSLTFRPSEIFIPEIDKFLVLSFAGLPENFTGGQGLSGGREEDFDLNRTPITISRTLDSYIAQPIPVHESSSIFGMGLILGLGVLLTKQKKTKNLK